MSAMPERIQVPTSLLPTSLAASESAEAIASLTGVTKRYSNGVLALDNLSLTLRRGEVSLFAATHNQLASAAAPQTPTTPPDYSALVTHLRVRSSHLKRLGYNSLSKIVGIAGNV